MFQESVISLKNLNHYFGQRQLRKQVLVDINLEIYRGEIVIMTGPSGSGKTTLLTLIGGLRSGQEGSLKVLNQELCDANKKQLVQVRRKIGYIFQAHNLLRCLTAQQNVQMSLELHEDITREEIRSKSYQVRLIAHNKNFSGYFYTKRKGSRTDINQSLKLIQREDGLRCTF